MQTQLANPAERTCQYVDQVTENRCTNTLEKGRGPRKYCLDCRELARREQNKVHQATWRGKDPDWCQRLNEWNLLSHRVRKGMAVKKKIFFKNFLPNITSSLPQDYFQSLHIRAEVQYAAINFHLSKKYGKYWWPILTLTVFGPSSVGHEVGARHAIQFAADNEISRIAGEMWIEDNEEYSCLKTFVAFPNNNAITSNVIGEEVHRDAVWPAIFAAWSYPRRSVQALVKEETRDEKEWRAVLLAYLWSEWAEGESGLLWKNTGYDQKALPPDFFKLWRTPLRSFDKLTAMVQTKVDFKGRIR